MEGNPILRAVREIKTSSDADIYFYRGEMRRDGYDALSECARELPRQKNCLLFLATYGGDADTAFRIGRALWHYYPEGKLSILVRKECKSAGTLLAIAGSELVMCDESELGPLDVQLSKRDELYERSSGLDIVQALAVIRSEALTSFRDYMLDISVGSGQQISVKVAAEMATKLVTGLFSNVYSQIDPLKLGEIQRAIAIAEAYGKRLDEHGKNLKRGALRKLVLEYPSHGFVIDRKEARSLFKNVRSPSNAEEKLADLIYNHIPAKSLGEPVVFRFKEDEPNGGGTSEQQHVAPEVDSQKPERRRRNAK